MVKTIACALSETLPSTVSFDDLISEGMIGLIQAVDRFDESRNDCIQRFAEKRIRGAMLDYLRTLDWASRDTRRMINRINDARVALKSAGLDQSDEAITEAAGVTMRDYRLFGSLGESAHHSISPFDNGSREYQAPDRAQDPLRQLMDSKMRETITQVIEHLPRRFARILDLYYFGELTMKQVGEELNIHETRVSQLHSEALRRCRVQMMKRKLTAGKLFDSPP